MEHNPETQTDSDEVANTFRRQGTYYFRKRIPEDVVALAPFGKDKKGRPKTESKFSLKTKDPKQARRIAARENQKFEERVAEVRGSPPLPGEAKAPSKPTHPIKRREKPVGLRLLSELNQVTFIDQLFINLERAAIHNGQRGPYEFGSRAERNEAIEIAGTDLAISQGLSNRHKPPEWKKQCYWALVDEGFDPDSNSAIYNEVCKLFKEAHIESLWRTVKSTEGNDHAQSNPRFKGIVFDSHTPPAAPTKSHTIERLCEEYIRHWDKPDTSYTHLSKIKVHTEVIRDFFGPEREVASINVEDARSFTEFLSLMPTNASKRYPNLSLKEASNREQNKEKSSFLSPKTQSLYLTGVKSIFEFASDSDWTTNSPFHRKIVAQILPRVGKRQPKIPPTTEDLNALIHSDIFLKKRKPFSGTKPAEQAYFWIPLLCMFHGCRSNEAAQLLTEDIQKESDIWCLCFNASPSETTGGSAKPEESKAMKNVFSERGTPLHSRLIDFGFLDFLEHQKSCGSPTLFPELKPTKKRKAGKVGSWFGRLKKKLFKHIPPGIGHKGLHSFRHGILTQLRNAGVPIEIREAIGGWVIITQRSSEAGYGDGFNASVLKEAIEKIQYPGVDFSPILEDTEHGV
ncbi:MAG: DUF6538 domain-containing protein [Akkermansiaceae bacterium]